MRYPSTLLIIAASLAVAACASTATSGRGGDTTFLSYDDCFFASSITDWRPLDNMNLVVFAGGRRAYHVQLSMRSMSLRYEDQLGFTDRDGRICPSAGTRLS